MRKKTGSRRTLDDERVVLAGLLERDLEAELLERRLGRVRDGLPRRRDEAVRVEQEPERDGHLCEVGRGADGRELRQALGEVDDPDADGEVAAAVATPRRGHGALGEVEEEGAQVVRLLELAVAHLDEVGEVGPDAGQERRCERRLALEEARERVLAGGRRGDVGRGLRGKGARASASLRRPGRASRREGARRTLGSTSSHSVHDCRRARIHEGCADEPPCLRSTATVSSSSSSERILSRRARRDEPARED